MLKISFRKQFGAFHLEVDQTITAKVTAFLGPSGSGKSTLLNCISGILHPDEGEITFAEQTLYSSQQNIRVPPEKRRFGYVFQEGHLFPHLTIWRNILYGCPRHHPAKNPIDVDTVIELLEIGNLLERYPHQLSGGQQQRVAVARALAMCPRLLLMDEPLASLDAGLKSRILPYLYHIKQSFDIPILYVTHSLTEATSLADEALCLFDGQITARGEPHALLTSPSALPVAQLAGVENLITLIVVGSSEGRGITELRLGNQTLCISYAALEIGKTVAVGIRARDIIVATTANLSISARNILRGVIRHIGASGGKVMLSVAIEEHRLSVEITSAAREQLALTEGQVCYLIIKASAINLLW